MEKRHFFRDSNSKTEIRIRFRLRLHGTGTGTVLKQTGPERLPFTRGGYGNGQERIQNWTCEKSRSTFGSVWVLSGPFPKRSRVNRSPIRFDFLDWISFEPVLCKHSLIDAQPRALSPRVRSNSRASCKI